MLEAIEEEVATDEELRSALAKLSDVDYLRIGKAARYFTRGIPYIEPDDLINEAVVVVLEKGRDGESRLWPKSIPFLVFFINVMKSMASSYRRSHKTLRAKVIPLDAAREGSVSEALSVATGSEDITIGEQDAKQQLALIWSVFKDDTKALAILDAIVEEKTKEDVLQSTSMSSHDYDAARKRIRRKLEQLKQI